MDGKGGYQDMQHGFDSAREGQRIYGDVLTTAEPDSSPCEASAVHRLIESHPSTRGNERRVTKISPKHLVFGSAGGQDPFGATVTILESDTDAFQHPGPVIRYELGTSDTRAS